MVVREVEVAVHSHCDKRAVGLKGYAVLVDEVILVGDIPAGARAGEVLHFADCTELTEKEGFLDGHGLHNEKDLMLNFSSTIGKLRAKLLDHSLELSLDALCGFPTPRTGICEEIGDDGTAGIKDIAVIHRIEVGHGLKVGSSVGGNFLPVSADFASDSVKRSHIFVVF